MIDLTKDEALQLQRMYFTKQSAEQVLTDFANVLATRHKIDLADYELLIDKGQLKPKVEATNGKQKK